MTDITVGEGERITLTPHVRGVTTELRVGRGLFERLPRLLADHAPAPAYAVVSDANVAALYGGRLRDALRTSGARADLYTFPAGETSKSPERWAGLVEALGTSGFGRDGCVVALGGGVTGDLAGFTAATYARGVALAQVPTSLLAMIDASIGGKTGLDLRAGKNLVGAFHDPALVVVDPALLETLPLQELQAGMAEAVKHGAIADAGYLETLVASAAGILDREPDALGHVVAGSIRIKVGVVERDARESGERAILNFGHTLAHGIERASGYAVRHGDAVAMGMVAECRVGERMDVTRPGTAAAVRAALEAFRLPVSLPAQLDPAAVLEGARSDKKGREGRVRYALIETVGTPARAPDGGWTLEAPDAVAEAALHDMEHDAGRRSKV